MSFRLVPKSVTLNDIEQRNGHYCASFGTFRANCVKVIEDTQILSATEM